MSAAAWMRRQRDRPLAEHERRTALVATAAVLIVAALGFADTRPLASGTPARAAVKAPTPAAPDPPSQRKAESSGSELSPSSALVSRAFLAGYLAYICGRAPASRITEATGAMLTALAAHPPRVSPAMRSEHPRVVELDSAPAPAGEIGVSAVVNDGGLIDYTLGLTLAPQRGRLLVSALEQS
jgi:hypothetical protein